MLNSIVKCAWSAQNLDANFDLAASLGTPELQEVEIDTVPYPLDLNAAAKASVLLRLKDLPSVKAIIDSRRRPVGRPNTTRRPIDCQRECGEAPTGVRASLNAVSGYPLGWAPLPLEARDRQQRLIARPAWWETGVEAEYARAHEPFVAILFGGL